MRRLGLVAGLAISTLSLLIFQAAAMAAPTDRPAVITVNVPSSAQIWFDGVATKQTGSARTFVSPPLPAGRVFKYTILGRWVEDGQKIEQTRKIAVKGGDRITVNWLPVNVQEEPARPRPPREETRILDIPDDYFPFDRRPSEWDH